MKQNCCMNDSRAGARARGRRGEAWRRWYSTQRWRARRKAQLASEPLCRMCGARGTLTAATVADHVVPHRGDYDLFWNGELQSLCASHHSSAKQSIEVRGFSKEVDANGWPIDPQHPANAPTPGGGQNLQRGPPLAPAVVKQTLSREFRSGYRSDRVKSNR